MKKYIWLVSILICGVLFLIFSGLNFAESKKDEFKRTHYIIDIKLQMPGLDPPAVQMAVFYEDPVNYFDQHLRIAKVNSYVSDPNFDPTGWMLGCWDGSFRMISGDRLYLLTMEPVRYTSSDIGKKVWIVTKAARVGEKPVCWRIPLKVKFGKEYQVVLSKNNQFDLEGTFNKIMSD